MIKRSWLRSRKFSAHTCVPWSCSEAQPMQYQPFGSERKESKEQQLRQLDTWLISRLILVGFFFFDNPVKTPKFYKRGFRQLQPVGPEVSENPTLRE